jgi:hypothetical protein
MQQATHFVRHVCSAGVVPALAACDEELCRSSSTRAAKQAETPPLHATIARACSAVCVQLTACAPAVCVCLQVGMGATLLDGVVMEPGSIVAAGAVVPPGGTPDAVKQCAAH